MSINDTLQKIKSFPDSQQGRLSYMIALILLASASSFGLGRLSGQGGDRGPVRIEYQAQSLVANAASATATPKAASTPNSANNAFVASKKGKKYYPAGCAGAASLKEDNKVFFSTETEAQAAGYTKSSSC